jgi:S1-C subfamily serine protease
MTQSRLSIPNLPLFLLAAAVVAILAFGITRWVTDSGATTLPALEVAGDTAAAQPGAMNLNNVITARVDTVVALDATIGGESMKGTGVVVDAKQGTIITASHVVKDYDRKLMADAVIVEFKAGDQVPAKVVALDQISDLAILKIDPAAVEDLVAAPLADSDQVLAGSAVVAIGAPLGYKWTPTAGIVSVPHVVLGSRINAAADISDAIQHDTAINTGNSGGPLFNARGEVIGINQQIATRNGGSVGLSFAVSSNLVKRALKQYETRGQIQYANMGIDAITLAPQLGRDAKLGAERGALVQQADGAAQAAGVSIGRQFSFLGRTVTLGDVIVGVAGTPIRSSEDLSRVIGQLDPDSPVELELVSAGQHKTVTVDPSPRSI